MTDPAQPISDEDRVAFIGEMLIDQRGTRTSDRVLALDARMLAAEAKLAEAVALAACESIDKAQAREDRDRLAAALRGIATRGPINPGPAFDAMPALRAVIAEARAALAPSPTTTGPVTPLHPTADVGTRVRNVNTGAEFVWNGTTWAAAPTDRA